MHRIKLVVAYDGSNYVGWQVQPNGVSVQSVLQAAIEDLVGEKIMLTGASRTDSGVHALGQTAVFDTEREIPAWQYAAAVNQRLPKDIRIQSSEEVPADFHPRYQKVIKHYTYRILNRRMDDPTMRLYCYHVPRRLDVNAMIEAAKLLKGKHDFKEFCARSDEADSTVREIYSISVSSSPYDESEDDGSIITINVKGDGFLYHMVRIIAGTLIKVGFGQKSAEDIRASLENPGEKPAGPTAPARGLTLVSIKYPEYES